MGKGNVMSEEFKVIETQEQFDEAVKSRVERERKKYAGWQEKAEAYDTVKKERDDFEAANKELTAAINGDDKNPGYKKQLDEMTSKVKSYERKELKMKVAKANGIPVELADRISGETEEEMSDDAKTLSKIFKMNRPEQRMPSTEPSGADSKKAAMKTMLDNLKGE